MEYKEYIAGAAEDIIDEAINNIAEKLPDDRAKADFLRRLDENMRQGMQAVINGRDYQQYLNRGAYETSVWLANHYANIALNRIVNEIPRSKARDTVQGALQLLTQRGIESLCRGDSLDEIKFQLSSCAKGQIKSYTAGEVQKLANEAMGSLYKNIKFSGRGSRKINRHLKAGSNIVGQELSYQILDNVGAVIDGRKNFGDAVTDITINTAKKSVITYGKQQGEEIAEKALKALADGVTNKIGKNIASSAFKEIAKSNAVITTAGAIYDVGKSFNKLMNGEITASEFVNTLVEKGVDVVVQNAATMIGTTIGAAFGGLPGAAIGSIIGSVVNYFASGFLNGIVNSIRNARSEAKLARQRYEFINAFCEYSICELKRQREEFERYTDKFISNRQQVLDRSLNQYELALQNNDFDSMTNALSDVIEEFGGELTFKTQDEFDKFMLS